MLWSGAVPIMYIHHRVGPDLNLFRPGHIGKLLIQGLGDREFNHSSSLPGKP